MKTKPKKKKAKVIDDTLNEDQAKAIELMREFLKSDDLDFVLKGRAGTGKTYVIEHLFRRKRPKKDKYYVPRTVLGVCISHQARINLMQRLPNTNTYAAAANLVMMYDPNGNPYFVPMGSFRTSKLASYKYIVFDECSMVDASIMRNMRACCAPDAKIIWMGDAGQLPPIGANGDEDSPTFNFKWQAELTIKMRQDNEDHIALLSDQVYEHIFSDHDLMFLDKLTNQYDVVVNKGYALSSTSNVIRSYVKNFKAGDDVRVTSYRNNRVAELNTAIREHLWEDKCDERFVKGELIIMEDRFENNSIVYAHNGQTFKVIDITHSIVDFVECYMLHVNRNGTMKKGKKEDLMVLPVPTHKGSIVYKQHLNKLKQAAMRSRKWEEHQSYKAQFASVAYGYCVTNYKIQGSTLKGCYVDLSDIMNVKPISRKRKLQAFYVGVSRPTDYLGIF